MMIGKQTEKNIKIYSDSAEFSDYLQLPSKLQIKYFLDRIFAYPLLFLFSPFILLVAWAIKLDGWLHPKYAGSVFYAEPRVSAGKLFKIVKFRTVTEETIRWLRQGPESRSITGSGATTCAGKFILRWYLDEIPQLFNIIKGEMSLVGPRPHIINQYNQEMSQGLLYRQVIKAGFFGVPQACKRHPKYKAILERMACTHYSENKMLNTLDGLYIKKSLKHSILSILLFDFNIIARCIIVIVRGGAKV